MPMVANVTRPARSAIAMEPQKIFNPMLMFFMTFLFGFVDLASIFYTTAIAKMKII